MYTRLPSITSIRSSAVASQLMRTVADRIRYSVKIALMESSSKCVSRTVDEKLIPPEIFFSTLISGGFLFNRMPTPSSSFSMIFFCWMSFIASSTMMRHEHVRATAMTCRPRPLPSRAPSMMPGRSSSCILAPFQNLMPGMHVSVVNSYEAASDCTSVSEVSSVDLPTEGKPTKPTRASPVARTSKPSPGPPPPPLGSAINSRLYLATFARSWQRCAIVALLTCVRAISASMSSIFWTSDMAAHACRPRGSPPRSCGSSHSVCVCVCQSVGV
mmetsp:Transcript_21838/g.66289  ORF Transcript_21838/g.66289 Transcript_21838/m.66289 type:complete len:272 (+) Transcript_21838:716-1531(+)